jgi:Circadian oscillating protein COP23
MNFKQMKNQLAILAMGVLVANAVFLAPAQAQTEGKFYCGQVYDPIGKTTAPATVMSSPRRAKPIVVIVWKSEYFGGKFSPQNRCEIVSPKFQAAYAAGNLGFFKAGSDGKNPIACAVRTENERCTKAGMLFTLKSFGNTQGQLNALMGNIEGGAAFDNNIYQSATSPSESEGVVNIREFLNSAK